MHLRLHDFNLKFNGYNQLISEDRNYICITDNESYRIIKKVGQDDIIIKSLITDIPDSEILNHMRKPIEKRLTYSMNEEVTKK